MAREIGSSVGDIESVEEGREWERASYAIFDAMDDELGVNMLEAPAVGNTVDLDAVDRFFAGDGDRSLSFEYRGVCVTVVRKDGQQRIVFD